MCSWLLFAVPLTLYLNTASMHFACGEPGLVVQVASMILDKRELEFYKYETDYKVLLGNVRDKINTVAEGWSREEKDHCLQETEASFKVCSMPIMIKSCIS